MPKGQSVLQGKGAGKARAPTAVKATPKPNANPLKPKKPKAGKTGLSHKKLNADFRKAGKEIAALAAEKTFVFDVPQTSAHKANVFDRSLKKCVAGELKAKQFNDAYRSTWPGQDELVSTSTVRELVFGILEEHKKTAFSKVRIGEIDKIVDAASRVRLPTQMIGYAFSDTEVMQHPTSPGTGYYALDETASLHSWHDTKRKGEVLDAVRAELKNPNRTADSVMKAAVRAAIAYTLNEMAAPITASDVKPYSKKKTNRDDDPNLIESLQKRETMKAVFVKLGGAQDADDPRDPNLAPLTDAERRGREWKPRRTKRSVSASRFPPLGTATATATHALAGNTGASNAMVI